MECQDCSIRLECMTLKGCIWKPQEIFDAVYEEIRARFPLEVTKGLVCEGDWTDEEVKVLRQLTSRFGVLDIREGPACYSREFILQIDEKIVKVKDVFSSYGVDYECSFNGRFFENWSYAAPKDSLGLLRDDNWDEYDLVRSGLGNIFDNDDVLKLLGVNDPLMFMYTFLGLFDYEDNDNGVLKGIYYNTDS